MKISRFDIVIHENGEKKAIEELCEKYGISEEELPDAIIEMSNRMKEVFDKISIALQPLIDAMTSFGTHLQATMEELRSLIPEEVWERYNQLGEDETLIDCIHANIHIPELDIYCDDCIADEERRNK